jgi:hypothetical protein
LEQQRPARATVPVFHLIRRSACSFDQDQSRLSQPSLLSPHHLKGENDMTGFEQTYLVLVLACFGAFAVVLGLTDLGSRSARK